MLLGAPGVGKGTQAEMLCAKLGACHLSTGDIFRAAKAMDACDRSPALSAALQFMRRGELVPDETVLALVSERIAMSQMRRRLFVGRLSTHRDPSRGFGGTPWQKSSEARCGDQLRTADRPNRGASERPRTCPECKAVFHVTALPPRVPEYVITVGPSYISVRTIARNRSAYA